jgi:glycosyltransferase involved in cell wall biosynthesis
MRYCVVLPAHNEEKFISHTLDSLVNQTVLPLKVVVVDDGSTDRTGEIVASFAEKYSFVSLVKNPSERKHEPGSKVIQAFLKGFQTLEIEYDIIVKADADLIFPEEYFETIIGHFQADDKVGMAGGFAYIPKENHWVLESLTDKDHIRGAFKAYRKQCFEEINGLQPAMGWDTLDELMAQFHGWKIKTDEKLKVKHLKPTGARYNQKAGRKQGEAYYRLGYGFLLTITSSLKLAYNKKKPGLFFDYLQGYLSAKRGKISFLVGPKERKFIRNYRWKKMKEKILKDILIDMQICKIE